MVLKRGDGYVPPYDLTFPKAGIVLGLKRLKKIKKIKDDGRIVYYYLIKRNEREKNAGASFQPHDRRMGDDFFRSPE